MNKKPIDISKSSLLSLKAEVLRKKQEVDKAKLISKSQSCFRKSKPKKNDNKEKEPEEIKPITDKDKELLEKSKASLEIKTQLYNDIINGVKVLEDDKEELYLIEFDKKIRENEYNKSNENESEEKIIEEYSQPEDDNDWVDYLDCLGRTRRCLKSDLAFIKERDEKLSASLPTNKSNPEQEAIKWFKDSVPDDININDDTVVIRELNLKNELLSNDMKRELLRQEWEKQEEELKKKTDIHYQDVLFSEARNHGVSYFNFSQNVDERVKQLDELKKLRSETLEKQDTIKDLKATRVKQLAARVRAAQNRKRARMGLPPLEDEPEVETIPAEPILTQEEIERKAKEEKEEKAKEEIRKHIMRPWDIGKEDVYEIKSQEQWVKQKRNERKKEFAPPSSFYISTERSTESTVTTEIKPKRDWFNVKTDENSLDSSDCETEKDKKSLFFTTKKSKNDWRIENSDSSKSTNTVDESNHIQNINPYKRSYDGNNSNYKEPASNQIYDPIINECEDSDSERKTEERKVKRKGAEITPPPTFEYYNSSSSKSKHPRKKESLKDIEVSIEAGLKFLRKQSDRKHAQTDNVGFFE